MLKNVRKIISFLCACAMMSVSVSCSGKKEKQDSGIKKISESKQWVYKAEDTGLVENGDILVDFEVVNDQIAFTKVHNEEFAQINTFDFVNFEMKNYDFNLFEFENGLSDCRNIYSNKKNCYLVNEFNDSTVIYTIDKEKLIISSVVIPDVCVQNFYADNKDMFYLSYNIYDIQSKSTIIDIYSGGKKIKTIDFSETLSNNHNIFVSDMYVDYNDNLYILYNINDDVYIAKLDNNGDIISNNIVEGVFGQANKFIASENGRFFVVNSAEAGTSLINEIDPHTCKTIEYYEENIIGTILNGVLDYDYLVYDNNTFIGIKKDEEIRENLYDSSNVFDTINIYEDECISFDVKSRYNNLLVKADRNTYEVISQTQINLEEDCYIVDSCFKNQEYIYLCVADGVQFLVFVDSDGNTIKREEIDVYEDGYIYCVETDGDNIYILVNENDDSYCIKFDENMNFISEVSVDNEKGNFKILYTENELYGFNGDLYKIDFENNENVLINTDLNISDIYQCDDNLVVKDEKDRVCFFNNSDVSEIINTSEMSFLNSNQISNIKFVDQNNFLIYSNVLDKLHMVNKLDESEVKDVNIIKLACDTRNTELKNIISEFNSENDDTMIVISDYSTDEKLEQLNTEIASGNVPDIIVSSGRMDMSIYENMGVLEDLTSYIEKDETINIDDYYTNIFRACSLQDKITQIVPHYTIITAVGKSSVLGEDMGWDYSEFSDFVSENHDKDIFYSGWFRDGMIYENIPYYAFSDFVDAKNKKIEINEKFAEFLSICKSYVSEQVDENVYYDKNELASEYDMRFRNDACLMDVIEISSIDMLCNLKDAIINEDIVLKGLPADNSNGSYVCPKLKISMLTTCKEKEKAWDFIRKYLEDEYQNQIQGSCFPVKKDAFESLYNKCEERNYYLGDTMYEVHVPNQEYKEMISSWVGSVTDSICSEKRISDIVDEELNNYFSNQQDEKETIKELERKIKLYISEVL